MGVRRLTALTAFLLLIVGVRPEVTEVSLQCNSLRTIISPGYPEPYNGMSGWSWIITAPLNRRILVSFEEFNTEAEFDDLIIKDHVWTSHKRRYSGEHHFPPFLSLSHRVHLVFRPDDSSAGNANGFNLTVSCYPEESATTRLETNGQLELKQDERWLPVCSSSWDDGKADIACWELGYPGAIGSKSTESSQVGNSASIGSCERSPHRLQDCATEVEQCQAGIIMLKCQIPEPGYIGCYNVKDLNINGQLNISVRSARECIISCHQRRYDTAIIQGRHCFCSKESSSTLQTLMSNDASCRVPCVWNTDEICDNKIADSVPVFNTTVGFCPQPEKPENGHWKGRGPHSHGSTVELICRHPFILNGNSSIYRCETMKGRNGFTSQWTGHASCIRPQSGSESTGHRYPYKTTSRPLLRMDSSYPGTNSCAPSSYLMATLLAPLYLI